MDTGKNTLSEDITKQILDNEEIRNEIVDKSLKEPAMKEKLNNYCCLPYPIPSNPIPFTITGCGIDHRKAYNIDCKYYDEEHDMGASIPICTKYDKFGNFDCHNQCGY